MNRLRLATWVAVAGLGLLSGCAGSRNSCCGDSSSSRFGMGGMFKKKNNCACAAVPASAMFTGFPYGDPIGDPGMPISSGFPSSPAFPVSGGSCCGEGPILGDPPFGLMSGGGMISSMSPVYSGPVGEDSAPIQGFPVQGWGNGGVKAPLQMVPYTGTPIQSSPFNGMQGTPYTYQQGGQFHGQPPTAGPVIGNPPVISNPAPGPLPGVQGLPTLPPPMNGVPPMMPGAAATNPLQATPVPATPSARSGGIK